MRFGDNDPIDHVLRMARVPDKHMELVTSGMARA